MNLKPLGAALVAPVAVACSAAPQAEVTARKPEPTTTDAPTTAGPEPTTSTTVTVTVTQAEAPALEPFVKPEDKGAEQTDAQWWRSQPGYSGALPSGACGGSLPPCWVMSRESKGDPKAVSPPGYCPSGDTRCRGKWQWDAGTWADFGGYAHADDAPESVQDEKARQIWAGGQGCSNWGACA